MCPAASLESAELRDGWDGGDAGTGLEKHYGIAWVTSASM